MEKWGHFCIMPKTSEIYMAGHAIGYCKEYDDKDCLPVIVNMSLKLISVRYVDIRLK